MFILALCDLFPNAIKTNNQLLDFMQSFEMSIATQRQLTDTGSPESLVCLAVKVKPVVEILETFGTIPKTEKAIGVAITAGVLSNGVLKVIVSAPPEEFE